MKISIHVLCPSLHDVNKSRDSGEVFPVRVHVIVPKLVSLHMIINLILNLFLHQFRNRREQSDGSKVTYISPVSFVLEERENFIQLPLVWQGSGVDALIDKMRDRMYQGFHGSFDDSVG